MKDRNNSVVMNWDGIVTDFHYVKAYIRSIMLKKTLKNILFGQSRGFNDDKAAEIDMQNCIRDERNECRDTI
ncbi:unnamed protein product [Thelazia callipaeda]|uniref:Tnp_DDE_dom domain-containing protein n=1 Tax=Thelazia callipaeda TaxID=103827 RepID=A0A0N5CVQ8_THECL|nr:unnamed protein product [Thelazia callipaeda]